MARMKKMLLMIKPTEVGPSRIVVRSAIGS